MTTVATTSLPVLLSLPYNSYDTTSDDTTTFATNCCEQGCHYVPPPPVAVARILSSPWVSFCTASLLRSGRRPRYGSVLWRLNITRLQDTSLTVTIQADQDGTQRLQLVVADHAVTFPHFYEYNVHGRDVALLR
eukprot:gene674-biopygen8874